MIGCTSDLGNLSSPGNKAFAQGNISGGSDVSSGRTPDYESRRIGQMKSLLRPPSGYRLGWACGAVLAVSLCAPQVVRGEEVTKSFGVTGRPDVRVATSGLSGTLNVDTGDGAVKANSLEGTTDLHTNDGGITGDALEGDIGLRTGDGSIEGRDLDGKVEADSGDGHVRLTGRFAALNVKTGDGSVDTKVLSGSKMAADWTLRTGDGSVDISLPADFQANIDATTGDGHISMGGIPMTVEGTFSRSAVHGKMNGGGQTLTIHTGDGSIRLSKS